jgi:transcriptional regulator with XRE-family HTH domain
MQTINDRVIEVRRINHLNQKEFSEITGIPRSSLSEIESGKRCPSVDLMSAITNKFKDISIDWVLTGNGEILKKSVTDIQNQKLKELDNEQLTLAIETVEEVLEEAEKTMLPKKKALLIMAVYDLFKDEEKPMKQPVLKLVRSAFA